MSEVSTINTEKLNTIREIIADFDKETEIIATNLLGRIGKMFCNPYEVTQEAVEDTADKIIEREFSDFLENLRRSHFPAERLNRSSALKPSQMSLVSQNPQSAPSSASSEFREQESEEVSCSQVRTLTESEHILSDEEVQRLRRKYALKVSPKGRERVLMTERTSEILRGIVPQMVQEWMETQFQYVLLPRDVRLKKISSTEGCEPSGIRIRGEA